MDRDLPEKRYPVGTLVRVEPGTKFNAQNKRIVTGDGSLLLITGYEPVVGFDGIAPMIKKVSSCEPGDLHAVLSQPICVVEWRVKGVLNGEAVVSNARFSGGSHMMLVMTTVSNIEDAEG